MAVLIFIPQLLSFLRLLLNHLINIPLIILAGGGKFAAVLIAFGLDMFQATIYNKILSGAKVSEKFVTIFSKISPQQNRFSTHHPKMFSLVKKLQYFGIFILASLPVYTGGICAAVFLSHTLSLNKYKSWVATALGSFTGCILWVLGIQWLFNFIKSALTYLKIL